MHAQARRSKGVGALQKYSVWRIDYPSLKRASKYARLINIRCLFGYSGISDTVMSNIVNSCVAKRVLFGCKHSRTQISKIEMQTPWHAVSRCARFHCITCPTSYWRQNSLSLLSGALPQLSFQSFEVADTQWPAPCTITCYSQGVIVRLGC